MESNQYNFDEIELKLVLFSSALIISAERRLDDRDWEIIQSFSAGYWKPAFGKYHQFQKRITCEINELLKDEVKLYETIDSLLTEFVVHFDADQKSIMLGLLGYLFASDSRFGLDESNLFATFLNRLGNEQPGL